jgi:isocitrate dehydrogenase (NAD+)
MTVRPVTVIAGDVGEDEAADRIRHALETTLRYGATLTPDLGGHATTTEFADAVLRRLG